MVKQIVGYSYNEILLNNKKEYVVYMCDNIGAEKEARQKQVHTV